MKGKEQQKRQLDIAHTHLELTTFQQKTTCMVTKRFRNFFYLNNYVIYHFTFYAGERQ